jgi:hypothetical protein
VRAVNFFDDEADKKYFIIQPRSHQKDRAFIRSDGEKQCIFVFDG